MTPTMVITLCLCVFFFALMLGIGFKSRKHAADVNGFVLGSRSVGPWLSAFAFGTSYFSAVIFVGYAGQFGTHLIAAFRLLDVYPETGGTHEVVHIEYGPEEAIIEHIVEHGTGHFAASGEGNHGIHKAKPPLISGRLFSAVGFFPDRGYTVL